MTGDRPDYPVQGTRRPFAGKVVSVRVDTVGMPGGHAADREVAEHDRAVAVVAVDPDPDHPQDPTVVLIEQFRHPLRRRLWELPAGLMDVDGEAPLEAAQRELAEETGLAAAEWVTLVDTATSPGFSTETIRIYLARGLTQVDRGEAQDEEADLRLVRLPLSRAVEAVFAGQIVNVSAVAGLLAAAELLRSGRTPRPAGGAWTSGPATVHDGADVPDAPPLPVV